jgi:polar amino acid transport system substrate-binding protein
MTFLRLPLTIAAVAVACLSFLESAQAQDAVCEPAKLTQKYPSLANRTLKIGADPQTQPY